MPVRNLPTKRTFSQKFLKYLVRSYDIKPVCILRPRTDVSSTFSFFGDVTHAVTQNIRCISDKIIVTSGGWLTEGFGAGLGILGLIIWLGQPGIGAGGGWDCNLHIFSNYYGWGWVAFGSGLGSLGATLGEVVPLT